MKIVILLLSLGCVFSVTHASVPKEVVSPTAQSSQKIDLNTVDENRLRGKFKGIGTKRAAAIVSYRQKNGSFSSISDLAKVPSIGKSFVKRHLSDLEQVFCVQKV